MGIFSQTTYEARYAGTKAKNNLKRKVIDYIIDNLNDGEWQESIAGQLREMEEQYSHLTLSIILRLFHLKDIEEGKLKSLTRYKKKDDKLVIDQMFVLDNLVDLSEDEMRIKLCDELFEFAEKVLTKYKNKFEDFDAIAFIPMLKDRIEKIKAKEL